ncbi:hypothetical protein RISK_000209 [Rhodopirellula islandica]|uniref:Uncharacterized protein n=1 Tax=Rhodopirellula islandica TaxID=595434 RepID=A0A0J1BMI5_RHOIS|nr:hypothetical protein RISK_000209 [Rhodopirellula islandica]
MSAPAHFTKWLAPYEFVRARIRREAFSRRAGEAFGAMFAWSLSG